MDFNRSVVSVVMSELRRRVDDCRFVVESSDELRIDVGGGLLKLRFNGSSVMVVEPASDPAGRDYHVMLFDSAAGCLFSVLASFEYADPAFPDNLVEFVVGLVA